MILVQNLKEHKEFDSSPRVGEGCRLRKHHLQTLQARKTGNHKSVLCQEPSLYMKGMKDEFEELDRGQIMKGFVYCIRMFEY